MSLPIHVGLAPFARCDRQLVPRAELVLDDGIVDEENIDDDDDDDDDHTNVDADDVNVLNVRPTVVGDVATTAAAPTTAAAAPTTNSSVLSRKRKRDRALPRLAATVQFPSLASRRIAWLALAR